MNDDSNTRVRAPGTLVFFQSTSAPDPDLACAYRQHLCTTSHFRSWSWALHRLWRQLTDTRHCHRQIVLRCLMADTQCSAVSPTARPAVAQPCVSRQQGRLLLLSAGRRLLSVVVQAAVHSQRRCSTCILRQAFGAHPVSYTHLTLPTIYSV